MFETFEYERCMQHQRKRWFMEISTFSVNTLQPSQDLWKVNKMSGCQCAIKSQEEMKGFLQLPIINCKESVSISSIFGILRAQKKEIMA